MLGMDCRSFFEGKRVTVMGLGLLGRGVGDTAFIAAQGAQVTVSDMKTAEELRESVSVLAPFPSIVFHLGGHDMADFTNTDMVIKAAGVPLDSPEIAAARAAGIPVHMSTALAAKFAKEGGAILVGVTGTRGKSTVTQMIFHVLESAGLPENRKAHLGGNIRGFSTLAKVPDITTNDVFVLELDSWQLQGFGELSLSPDIAVFTNLMPDHQNYYPNMDAYFADKKNIYAFQKEGGVLIAGRGVADDWIHDPRARVPTAYPGQLQLIGDHNRDNAALAAEALRALGIGEAAIAEGFASFEPVEGRLQLVRELRDVQIVNDNNATTPEATIAALRSLDTGKNIVLIMGGADKGLDMDALLAEVAKRCKHVALLSGTGTERIAPLTQDYATFDSLEKALHDATQYAQKGDVILFSPAFASFGMFQNEYDRNDQFMKLVNAL